MTICAVCRLDNGLVINLIVAEPTDPAPYGCQLIELIPDEKGNFKCSTAWTWNGTEFIDPNPVDPNAPAPDLTVFDEQPVGA